jgi:uncharacterized protein YneF (UPF0154 family)
MRKPSWPAMLLFVICLLLGVILIGLGTAHISKFKQQRRQLSDNGRFISNSLRIERRPWAFAELSSFS